MASKMILDRVKSCDEVQTAGTKFVLPNTHRYVDEIGPEQDAAVESIVSAALARMLGHKDGMVAAEQRLGLEGSQDTAAQQQVDKQAGNVREVLVPARQILTGRYGAEYVAQIGFEGPTPDDAVALLHLARTVLLRVAEIPPPPARLGGDDPATLLAPLPAVADGLAAALSHRKIEQRETEIALEAKRRAMARYDRSFSVAAKLVSTFLELIDERTLAKKVRPSNRRPGNTVAMAGGDPEPVLPPEWVPAEPGADADADADVPAAE